MPSSVVSTTATSIGSERPSAGRGRPPAGGKNDGRSSKVLPAESAGIPPPGSAVRHLARRSAIRLRRPLTVGVFGWHERESQGFGDRRDQRDVELVLDLGGDVVEV